MFGSIDNVNLLSRASHLMMDGTFSSSRSPQLWQQLLTVYGLFDFGWHMPLVYGLLPGKTQVLYTDFFSEMDSFANFEPQSVLCDFEKGLHNAVSEVWPPVTIRGRNSLHTLRGRGLVTLPENLFSTSFSGISTRLFFAGLRRSNNLVEGWHNGFQTLVGASNPTLWKFVTAVKKEANLTFSMKVKMRTGESPKYKHNKWRLYNERLSNIVNDFDEYDPMEYLYCIGVLLFRS